MDIPEPRPGEWLSRFVRLPSQIGRWASHAVMTMGTDQHYTERLVEEKRQRLRQLSEIDAKGMIFSIGMELLERQKRVEPIEDDAMRFQTAVEIARENFPDMTIPELWMGDPKLLDALEPFMKDPDQSDKE